MPSSGEPVRPVAVLDACVLIPAALRDLLLSCADVGVFRPVWQEEILNEVKRNRSRLLVEKNGLTEPAALAAVEYILSKMADAFPDAIAASSLWVPLVPDMTCDLKDRHVLAVAVGTAATHLVTDNTRDFPVASRPHGVAVVKPDRFMRDQLASSPDLVVEAVESMSRRLKKPKQTPVQLAELMTRGQHLPRFGAELRDLLA